jgi:hypothetical protein
MTLEEIKEIIHKEGGKIVIVEQGKPQMVIMAFEEWRNRKPAATEAVAQRPAPTIPAPQAEPPAREGLTIDDLPL